MVWIMHVMSQSPWSRNWLHGLVALAAIGCAALATGARADCLCGTAADGLAAERAGLELEWLVQIPFDAATSAVEHVVISRDLVVVQTGDGNVVAVRAGDPQEGAPLPGTPTTAKADTRKTRPGPRFTSPLHMSKIRRRPKANAPPHAPVSSGGTWIMAGKQGTASRGDERRQMPSGPEGPGKPAGGGERDRTDDLMLAKHALSQLSYAPEDRLRPSSRPSRRAIRFAPLKRKT